MDEREKIEAQKLLEEIKLALKEVFVASVRSKGDELVIEFPNGQIFALTVCEDKFHRAK